MEEEEGTYREEKNQAGLCQVRWEPFTVLEDRAGPQLSPRANFSNQNSFLEKGWGSEELEHP